MCRARHPLTVVALFALLALLGLAGSTPRHAPASKPQVQAGYARLPLSFEVNQGQVDGQVQFLSRGAGYSLFLTGTEAVLSLRGTGNRGQAATAGDAARGRRGDAATVRDTPNTQHPTPNTQIRMKLAGANPNPEVRGMERLPGVSNYFLGNDPQQWRTNVPHYAKVRYEAVYPGIDLVYYGNQQQLEYDFLVAPGADPDQVRLSFEGAQKLEVDAQGDLLLHTAGGTVRQYKPVVYQQEDGACQEVEAKYRLLADGSIAFALGAYDSAQPLVIDPVLTYATFLGAGAREVITGVAVDDTGSVYVTGWTQSADFPVARALQPAYGGGDYDIFVTKINPSATELVYSTYLGGSHSDLGGSIAVDAAGGAYVCGTSYSGNFPTTPDAFDTTLNGVADGYVLKLSPAGDGLVYSTYLGGSGSDELRDVTIDRSGTAYVTGSTQSMDFPTTPGAFRPSHSGGPNDAFVTRVSATGSSLLYATYLGGSGDDSANSIAVDRSNCAYVTGVTGSGDFPVTPDSFDTELGGDLDVYAAKLSPTGSALIYSTFVGGGGSEYGNAIAVDAMGSACLAGWIASTASDAPFPTTLGAIQPAPGGWVDAFVLRLNPQGGALIYSTFLGGEGWDEANGIAVGSTGTACVTGWTTSPDFPLWQPLQPDRAGEGNAFVTSLAPDGAAVFSTYLGGGKGDLGRDIALDASGAIYVGGSSRGGVSTTLYHHYRDLDGLIVKIALTAFPPPTNLVVQTFARGQAELSWTDNSSDETGFGIERKRLGDFEFQWVGTTGSDITRFVDSAGPETYVYRVRAVGANRYSGYTHQATVIMALQRPAALRATRLSDTEARLTWQDQSTVETHFLIERKAGFPDDPGVYTEVARAGADATSLVISGMQPGGSYTFRMRAAILSGSSPAVYSAYSDEAAVALLTAPSDLTATAISGCEIRLAWRDNNTAEAGFRIERRSPGGAFVEVGTVEPNIASYVDSGLADLTSYVYRVLAYNKNFISFYSAEAVATTLLKAPSGLAGVPLSGRRLRLTWTDNSTRESGYQIERKTGTGAFTLTGTTAASATSFTDAGLTPLTSYTYRVRAVSAANTSLYSNESAVTTLADVPEPPSALALTVSTGIVQLRWSDNSTNEIGFKVERRNGGSYSQVAVLPAGSVAFTDRGLTGGGTYLYRVRAYNANGSSLYSNEAQAILTGPPAPSNAVAAAGWGTRIRLTWQDNSSGEYGFRIERRTGTGSFSEVRVLGSNLTELLDTSLTPGTQYTYRVRAYNGLATSSYSNTATATTPAPPAAPSLLAAALLSSTRIRLVWRDNSPDETGFRLERKAETGNWAELRVLGPNTTSFVDAGAAPGTAYTYRVRAYGPGGFSPYSNEAQAISEGIPAAPSALALTVSTGIVQLRWQDNSNNERGFKVERRSGTGNYAEVSVVAAGSRAFTDRGLPGGGTHTYRVRAYNAAGDSQYSNEATAVLAGPPAPSNATAVAVWGTRVRLTWQDNSSGEYGFRIERKTGSAGSFAEVRVVGSNVTELLDTGLAVGTQYAYRVRAYNGIGTSPYSNEATAVTPAPPAAPTSLTATVVSGTWIRLAWQDGSTNESGFRIERKSGTGGWVEFRTVPANSASFENVGLAPNTSYTYRVRAYGPGGMSGYSNEASATTQP